MEKYEVRISDFDEEVRIDLEREDYETGDLKPSNFICIHPDDVEPLIEKIVRELRQAAKMAKQNQFYVPKLES